MTPSPRPIPSSLPPVQYKGSDLDAARGPGLGCFWIQIVVLVILIVLTPIGVSLGWPDWLNALLLFATIGLLLVSGQTIIFLLRIVAAERREGRRRPMAAARTATVGELEDEVAPRQAVPDALEAPEPGSGGRESAPPAPEAASEPVGREPAGPESAVSEAARRRAPGGPALGEATSAPADLPGDERVRE